MSRKPPRNAKATSANWERMFRVLRFFQKAHRHCDVPASARRDSLSHWLAEQRQDHRAGRLRPERVQRLEALGVVLDELSAAALNQQMDRDRRWNKRFAELAAYKKRFGHCDVPCHSAKNRLLGNWVSNQRSFRKKGWLSQERIDRLDKLGFRWVALFNLEAHAARIRKHARTMDRLWNTMFAAVVTYKKKHGHSLVQPDDGMDGRLHRWAAERRSEARKGTLRADRRRRLDKVGFQWGGHYHRWIGWETRFAQLAAYKKRFGDCDVPCHWPKDRRLGHWVSNQRSFRCKGWLSQERIDRLDKIGFRWLARFRLDAPPQSFREQMKALDQLWESKLAELVRFKKKHGHCRIPSTDSRWHSLFRWAERQRQHWRAGRLPKAHRRPLDKLGFSWKPHNPSWELKFAQLLAYKERFGHCEVPARWPGNKPLATWVHHQREFKRDGTLSRERIRRLNGVGFAWGSGRWPQRAK